MTKHLFVPVVVLFVLTSAIFGQAKAHDKTQSGNFENGRPRFRQKISRRRFASSFHSAHETRLSEQDNPTRGIGAARDWIYRRIPEDQCGLRRLPDGAEADIYAAKAANRIPEPVTLTNVFAVLKGTTDPDRVYVVSGHYDSMCNVAD